jgi:hypothetical protein
MQTLDDVYLLVTQAAREQEKLKMVNIDKRFSMEQIDNEVDNEWFMSICLLADVEYSFIKNKIAKIKLDSKWDSMLFGVLPDNVKEGVSDEIESA